MNNKNARFSWLAFLLIISFFAVAVAIGLVVASQAQNQTNTWLLPILVGAFVGFFCAWLLYFTIAQIYMRVIQRGPFHVGDRVEITNGPHKGKTGTIRMMDKEQGFFRIDLGGQSKEWDDNYFRGYGFRRIRK